MEQFLERVMNFINENTMLLIVICIFLIIILIIYLIDNTIKTRRLEKTELDKKNNPEPKVIENVIPEKEETKEPEIEEKQPIEEQKEETVIPVVPAEEPTSVEPVVDSNIDELLNKDYSINNEIVNNISEEEIKEVPKSKYNNDKKLSDIFGKKEEPIKNIETTQDFSNELDKILKKLNEEENNIDNSSLEDTSNYTNMF